MGLLGKIGGALKGAVTGGLGGGMGGALGGAMGAGKAGMGGGVVGTIADKLFNKSPASAAPVSKSPGAISNMVTGGSTAPSSPPDISSGPGQAMGRRTATKKFSSRRSFSGRRG